MTVVAVYGSLRKGMGNHRLLEGQTYLSQTRTCEKYAMYSLGGFPMVSLNGDKLHQIVVELYEVDDNGLARLDQLEGYRGDSESNFYDRSGVQTEDGNLALIYHIENRKVQRQESVVPDGDWVEYVKARSARY